jgi:hypothetical protein
MNNINLDPNAMLDAAFSRIPINPVDYNSLSQAGVERVLLATREGLTKSYTAFNVASAGFGEYRLGAIDLGGWIHGIPYDFVEILKTISFFVSLILAILFVSIYLRLRPLNKKETSIASEINPPEPAPGGPLTARWEEVLRHLDSVKEAEWKFGIIEADKLLEQTLKRAGYPGDTLGERLSLMKPDQLQSLDGVWEAHKIRNRIAHDLNYFLRYTEAKHAIDQYKKALQELGAI